jgi:hypothetical protein
MKTRFAGDESWQSKGLTGFINRGTAAHLAKEAAATHFGTLTSE